MKFVMPLILLAGLVFLLGSCRGNNSFDIRDHPLLDRRISETPRMQQLRECRQETERFRVSCTYCHSTGNEAEITAADPKLVEKGVIAKVMRKSPTFGAHEQCSKCHQSKFHLNQYASDFFGPGGKRHREIEEALKRTAVK